MATIKSSSTTFTREYTFDDGDDKATLKVRLAVPFDLPPDRAKAILDDMVQALEIERDAYLERVGGRQTSFLPRATTATAGRAASFMDREPAYGGMPIGDRA